MKPVWLSVAVAPTLIGFFGLLLINERLSREQRDRLGVVQWGGSRLLAIMDDVLDMAKIEAGRVIVRRAAVDLSMRLTDVLQTMRVRAEGNRLSLSRGEAGDLPGFVYPDRPKLRQILINRMLNAVAPPDLRPERAAS
jgi:signal transduction histidine kinase